MTGHVADGSTSENLTTPVSVISTNNSTAVRCIFTDSRDNIGVTLPESSHDSQSGIYFGLEPPLSVSSPICSIWPAIDPRKVALLEAEIEMDLKEESLHDYLLNQDMGLMTLWDASRQPVSNRAPYKQMPNFGASEMGQSRLLLLVVGTTINCEEAGFELDRLSFFPGPWFGSCRFEACCFSSCVATHRRI